MRNLVFGLVSSLVVSCGVSDDTQTSDPGPKSSEADPSTSDDDDDDDDDNGGGDDSRQQETPPTGSSHPTAKPSFDASAALCERKTIHAQSVPPDVLIVLDKSASMLFGLRWDPSRMAVEMLVSEFESQVHFGLSMFPAGDLGMCDPGELDVPLDIMNAAQITQQIDAVLPFGITPTAQTLENALMFLGDRSVVGADSGPAPATYVLLVTDGEPNCPDLMHLDPTQGSIDAVSALHDADIKTFVIGYEVGLGAGLMDQLAQAGGTDHYYPVENQTDLTEAFHEITKDIISCTFELTEVPPDPTYVRIELDGKTVGINTADGWVINGKVITLQGAACNTLRDGVEHKLESQVECEPVLVM